MERRDQVGPDSYDRFFPNQDTMPKGGLGNLIALPLQFAPRKLGNSVFIDADFPPLPRSMAVPRGDSKTGGRGCGGDSRRRSAKRRFDRGPNEHRG